MSAPYVYSNPEERYLDRGNISVALAELKKTMLCDNRIVCNLSASGLTLDCVSVLPAQLKPLKYVYALDLSSNRIRATWPQLCCRELFGWQRCAIPGPKHEPVATHRDFARRPGLLDSYKSFGERLSLGFDAIH